MALIVLNEVEALGRLEQMMEHLQSAWIGLGTSSFNERYEKTWPMGTPQYHLQAAELAGKRLFQVLVVNSDGEHE
jgi:hypothetical protein